MGRRTYQQTEKGHVYAVEWPEWHVDCACESCDQSVMIGGPGEMFTAKAAERKAGKELESDGWRKVSGYWYCPTHASEAQQ